MPRRRKPKPPFRPRPTVGFDDVIERLEVHGRPFDRAFLADVHAFTADQHRNDFRRSGEPYVNHPVYVAYLLADLKFDATCVAVGFLHDVLEDTETSREELASLFGEEIAQLVDGVTKIGKQEYVRRDEAQAETFRKMILASARDLRVILVKLADRLHNMLTLEHMPAEKRRRIATETLEIYSPIALRLGMSRVQGDLEDLAFFYRYPLQFSELQDEVREKMRVGKDAIRGIRAQLRQRLEDAGIDAEISDRVKRYYSIYRKLRRQGIDIHQLYDYLAFRIITTEVKECYAALGVVHQGWRPIPGRFKDYIAVPKPNLYQSLHTTLFGEKGKPFEVQIRTREMDLVAEEGIAAHWQYKEGHEQPRASDPNILWLRQLLEWQKEVEDPREFLSALKIDLYPDEVYVFSPQGDVYSFPRGATALDFAYRIHTDLGHRCSGARINGRLVPIKTELQNGDMIEILTAANRKPSRDWLNIVATSRARSKIRHWLNTEQKREAATIGRRVLERELRKVRISPRRAFDGPKLDEVLRAEGVSSLDELFQRVGYGKASWKQVLRKLIGEEFEKKDPEPPGRLQRAVDRIFTFGTGPVTVRGEGDLLTYLAKCCSPIPGDDLLGYVTRGRGVSVHAANCPNVRNLTYDPDRLIEVEWGKPSDTIFPVPLVIETEDKPGMLARLTEVIARESSNIRQFEAETVQDGGLIGVVIDVRNRKHLDRCRQAIRGVSGVRRVRRRMGSGARVAPRE